MSYEPSTATLTYQEPRADDTRTERQVIEAVFGDPRRLPARTDLRTSGRASDGVHLLVSGWAMRHKLLPDGRRQIAQLNVPGEVCALDALAFDDLSYDVTTLTPCMVATVGRDAVLDLAAEQPRLAAAFRRLMAVENAMLTEHVMRLGQQSALERLAHLLCELQARQAAGGRVLPKTFDLPLTQNDLADLLGLTSVHVNRTLQTLRRDGLIRSERGGVTIEQGDRLRALASFNPGYLHLRAEAATSFSMM